MPPSAYPPPATFQRLQQQQGLTSPESERHSFVASQRESQLAHFYWILQWKKGSNLAHALDIHQRNGLLWQLLHREFANLLACLSAEVLGDDVFKVYDFTGMPKKIQTLTTELIDVAVKRWHTSLSSVEDKVSSALPADWQKRSIDIADADWIHKFLLTPLFIKSVGADYTHALSWISSMDSFESFKT